MRDRILAEAIELYDRQLGSHGIPAWIAQDPERDFVIDEVVDNAAAVLEEAQAEYAKGQNVSHGLRLVVVEKGKRPDLAATP